MGQGSAFLMRGAESFCSGLTAPRGAVLESLVMLISVASGAGPRDTKSGSSLHLGVAPACSSFRGSHRKSVPNRAFCHPGRGHHQGSCLLLGSGIWGRAGEGGTIFLSGLNVIFEFCPKGDKDGSVLEKCVLETF